MMGGNWGTKIMITGDHSEIWHAKETQELGVSASAKSRVI